jgi:hypothetical protein
MVAVSDSTSGLVFAFGDKKISKWSVFSSIDSPFPSWISYSDHPRGSVTMFGSVTCCPNRVVGLLVNPNRVNVAYAWTNVLNVNCSCDIYKERPDCQILLTSFLNSLPSSFDSHPQCLQPPEHARRIDCWFRTVSRLWGCMELFTGTRVDGFVTFCIGIQLRQYFL